MRHMQRIALLMGDESADGHGMTTRVTIQSNFSKTEIENAYKLGIEKVGFDFIETVAIEHEDHTLSEEQYSMLVKAGIDIIVEIGYKGKRWIDQEEFADIYLKIAKLGNKKLKCSVVNDTNVIDIGGYGLLYQ